MKNILILISISTFLSCEPQNLISINEDGVLLETYEIDQDSLRHGTTKKYFKSGQPFEISNYEHGKLNGERLLFYENGQVEIRENYCSGMFCDTLTTYHTNGIRKFQGVYNHGIMSGLVTGFYETGELKEEVTFLNNIEQGPFKEYHKNGQLKWEGSYLDGPNEFGVLSEYDSLGQKVKVMMCDTSAICRTIWPQKDNSI